MCQPWLRIHRFNPAFCRTRRPGAAGLPLAPETGQHPLRPSLATFQSLQGGQQRQALAGRKGKAMGNAPVEADGWQAVRRRHKLDGQAEGDMPAIGCRAEGALWSPSYYTASCGGAPLSAIADQVKTHREAGRGRSRFSPRPEGRGLKRGQG